jgi:hypothetical protein
MKPEVQEFLEGLEKEDIADLKEIIQNKQHKRWIFNNVHYLIKGLMFLITAWIAFETFFKNLFIKLIH